jgi:4'-phosphopantetheinyl transferase EntD
VKYKGEILLRREVNSFKAGFCVIKKDFSDLIKEIYILHPEEHDYYESLRFNRRKNSYLLGRVSAKNAVLELLTKEPVIQSVSIQFGVFQFPVVKYIENENIQVSISHCDNYGVAFAFPEEHPMGIDIEKINKDKLKTLKSAISYNEFDKIATSSLSVLIGSTLIWTIKESLSKALKTGLTVDFKILEIESLEKVGPVYVSTFIYFSQYKAISKKIGNYLCSVVLPKKTSTDLDCFWNALADSMMKNNDYLFDKRE